MVKKISGDQDKIPITREGLKEIKEEYDRLAKEKRPKIVERMTESRSPGNLTEENDYTQAKQELAFVDGKISELEDVLSRATLIDRGRGKCKKVRLGCKVTVADGEGKDTFYLVGEWEADPVSKRISDRSLLGKSLLGKKVGDEVEVDAPAGKIVYTVKQID